MFLKRTLDVAAAATGLLMAAPLLAVIAVLIRLDSRGPVFFRQVRAGRGFSRFEILKFRTMRLHAQEQGPLVTSAGDSRVTRIGGFLRRCKLDELPQLWNVFRGDMSLVGPRPEVPHYVELFRDDYAVILTVRPGITDLASLTFRNEEQILAATDDPEQHYTSHVLPAKIALNKDYVRRSSFGFDLEVMGKTIVEAVGLQFMPPRGWLIRHRGVLVIGLHVAMIVVSSYGAFWLRFDGEIPDAETQLWLATIPLLVLIRAPIFAFFRLYQGLWSYTSIYDLQHILVAVAGSELLFFVVVRIGLGHSSYPRSVFIVDAMLLVFLMGSIRLAKRFYESLGRLRANQRALIIGSGDRADFVIRAMKSHVLADYLPIGIITLSPGDAGRIHGVPVLGNLENLDSLVKAGIADELILAYDRGNKVHHKKVMEALKDVPLPARDAFQLMATIVNAMLPPGSPTNVSDVAEKLVRQAEASVSARL